MLSKRFCRSSCVKLGSLFIMLMVLLLLGTTQAYAGQVSSNASDQPRVEVTISAFDQRYKLLDVYEDNEAALTAFTKKHPGFLAGAKSFGLPELTVETASEYKSYAMGLDGVIAGDEFGDILAFLDIYENPSENEFLKNEILSLESAVDKETISIDEAESQAEKILPVGIEQRETPVALRNSGINLSNACNYAFKYATSYNSDYGYERTWYLAGADCTNFASQILHAGGIGMDYHNDIASGWWWRSIGNRSLSWIQANTFANYMGSGYNSTSWNSLKNNVRAGDFIGYDSGDDGAVDHIGFVYSKSSTQGLRIAQHSADYLRWEGETGWPNISGRYYRIRR